MEVFLGYIAKSGGIVVLFYLCYRLFLHRETFFRAIRFFLVSGILLSVLLPFAVITRVVDIPLTEAVLHGLSGETKSGETTGATVIWQVVFWLYISGVFFFLGRLAVQLLSLKQFLRQCHTRERQGSVTIAGTSEEVTPFSFLNYLVYNPSMYPNKSELDVIFEHEKVHIREKHSLDIILAHLFAVFQWWNPVAWLYKQAVACNLEYLADRGTVQKGTGRKEYQQLLVRQLNPSVVFGPVTNTFFNSSIKKRLIMLNKRKSNRKQLWKLGIVVPVMGLFLLAVNTETVAQVRVIDDKGNNPENALIIVDGKVLENGSLGNIDPETIADMEVLKGENAVREYGRTGRDGVVRIFTKDYREKYPAEEKTFRIRKTTNEGRSTVKKQPRVVINGKMEGAGFDYSDIDPSDIKEVTVLKDKMAVEKYGEKGVNGVIEIRTKEE